MSEWFKEGGEPYLDRNRIAVGLKRVHVLMEKR